MFGPIFVVSLSLSEWGWKEATSVGRSRWEEKFSDPSDRAFLVSNHPWFFTFLPLPNTEFEKNNSKETYFLFAYILHNSATASVYTKYIPVGFIKPSSQDNLDSTDK